MSDREKKLKEFRKSPYAGLVKEFLENMAIVKLQEALGKKDPIYSKICLETFYELLVIKRALFSEVKKENFPPRVYDEEIKKYI